MRKTTTLILSILTLASAGFAEERAVDQRQISPDDLVQDSIQLIRLATNNFAVKWTYTEAGAKKALTFWEAHPNPHAIYTEQWKAGWLKRRTDKGFFKSEEAAKIFLAELSKK